MRFGFRRPSFRKRLAARTSLKRVIRHSLGVKAPRGWGWLTNPKRAAYNRVYNRTTMRVPGLRVLRRRAARRRDSGHDWRALVSSEIWAALIGALVGGAIGAVSAIYAATYGQDREHAIAQRNAAVALREDVRRIRRLLGTPGIASINIDSSVCVAPRVHDWVEQLVAAVASADPDIVAGFMQLQEDLNRREHLCEAYVEAARTAGSLEKELGRLEQAKADQNAEEVLSIMRSLRELRPRAEATRPKLAEMAAPFIAHDADLRHALDQLEQRLSALANKQLPTRTPDPDPPARLR